MRTGSQPPRKAYLGPVSHLHPLRSTTYAQLRTIRHKPLWPLAQAATTNVSIFIRSLTNVVVGLGAMFYTSWRLTLLTLSVTPVVTFFVMIFGRKIRALSKATSAAAAEAASVAGDSLGAIRVVKAFGREEAEGEHFKTAVAKTLALGITYAKANGIFSAVSLGVMISVMVWRPARKADHAKLPQINRSALFSPLQLPPLF